MKYAPSQEESDGVEFFDSTSELDPSLMVDCHFDEEEGQHFFYCSATEQERHDPFHFQDICIKSTFVNCVHGTCDEHLATLLLQQSEKLHPSTGRLSTNYHCV